MDTITPVEIQGIAAVLVTGIIELVKWLYRKYVAKDMSYSFPVPFYALSVPLLNALMPFVLVYGLGFTMTAPILTLTVVGVVRYLVIVALGAAGTFLAHDTGIKPLKDYSKRLDWDKDS